MDGDNILHTFWMPLFAYSLLLGVLLIILGIALAALASSLARRDSPGGKKPAKVTRGE